MQVLLGHSVQSYDALPSKLHPSRVRSLASSRPSPYPASRISKSSVTTNSLKDHTQIDNVKIVHHHSCFRSSATCLSPRIHLICCTCARRAQILLPACDTLVKDEKLNTRPRVTSTARRSVLGWSKRTTDK